MTAPQFDVLRPSPLDVGGVIGGSFTVLKQRFGQFAVLALIPTALMLVLLVVAVVPLILGLVTSVSELRFSGLIVLGFVLMFAAMVVGYLAQIKIQAMITLGSHDVIHHHSSSAGDLFRRTAGVVGRVLPLVLLVLVAVFVVYGLVFGLTAAMIVGSVAATGATSGDVGASVGAAIGAFLIAVLVLIALGVFIYYLVVRFLYFLPALAVENLGAVEALKRSWRLTRGNFLRTLGYIIVATLLVTLAGMAVSLLGELLILPGTAGASSSSDPGVALLALLPGLVVSGLLSSAVQILALPFLTAYVTVMYVDQLRRNSVSPGSRPGAFPPAPGAQWEPVNPPQHPGSPFGPPPQHPPNQQGWNQF